MTRPRARSAASTLLVFFTLSCHREANQNSGSLREYAKRAREHGSRQALVPYAIDEEEGEMLIVRSIDEALAEYEWVVGEPIEERSITISRTTNSTLPDAIYRFDR